MLSKGAQLFQSFVQLLIAIFEVAVHAVEERKGHQYPAQPMRDGLFAGAEEMIFAVNFF